MSLVFLLHILQLSSILVEITHHGRIFFKKNENDGKKKKKKCAKILDFSDNDNRTVIHKRNVGTRNI